MTTQGFVVLTLMFREVGKRWTGICQELGTATNSRTLKRTHKELCELVTLHLNSLEVEGERERFFSEHGIKFYTDEATPTEVERQVPVDTEDYIHAHRVPILTAV